ncbi:MAG: Na(+)/H(+) antiporter subunit B [Thermoanaerobaculia bacterium]|nr:Na(+)/H(+) antiporter subunit B [Thermoanaerobaculia bacterium]MCZ7652634.1 Na(+)/H(+) antiporter subunit B [Thermoanaerobaculia bacterium]
MRSRLLLRATRVVLPLAALFALALFVKGHDEPGGGFVAGLSLAIGAVLSLAAGAFPGRRLAAAQSLAVLGLLLVLATLLVPLAAGRPALTHAFGKLPLPWGESLKWHGALLFDLGVLLAVAGGITAVAEVFVRGRRPGEGEE